MSRAYPICAGTAVCTLLLAVIYVMFVARFVREIIWIGLVRRVQIGFLFLAWGKPSMGSLKSFLVGHQLIYIYIHIIHVLYIYIYIYIHTHTYIYICHQAKRIISSIIMQHIIISKLIRLPGYSYIYIYVLRSYIMPMGYT